MKLRKRWFQCLIAIILVLCISSAVATSIEKEEQYKATILQLESWLDTPGKSVDELQNIVDCFDGLKAYNMSNWFSYYSDVLVKAFQNDYGTTFQLRIHMLEQNDRFQEYLRNDINSFSILSVGEMINYVRGMEAEYNNDIASAMDYYKKSMNFYDASDRYQSLIIKEYSDKYIKAQELANNKQFEEAYFLFAEVQEYEDSKYYMEYIIDLLGYDPAKGTPTPTAVTPSPKPETPTPTPTIKLSKEKIKKGKYVSFGTYPQKRNGKDKTPIEWLVLAVDKDEALLISRYGIDGKPYHEEKENTSWKDCTLRKWLNGDFYKTAFTKAEKTAIQKRTLDNSGKQCYWEWDFYGDSTKDRIFILSYKEADKYFNIVRKVSNKKSRLAPTAYAVKNGAYRDATEKTSDGDSAGWWWLRSPGHNKLYEAGVNWYGQLMDTEVYNTSGSVRPALWLDLNADYFVK